MLPALLNLTDPSPPLSWPEMIRALDTKRQDPAVRAIMQLLDYELSCARSHEELADATLSQRSFGAGGAKLATKAITVIHLLATGQGKSEALKEWRDRFGAPEEAEEEENEQSTKNK